MQRKYFVLSFFLFSIALISCASEVKHAPTATGILTATPSIVPTSTLFWITPAVSLTLEPTITPKIIEPFIPSNGTGDISSIIVQIYSINPECVHSVFADNPNIKTKVEFAEIAEPNLMEVRWIQAISNSPDGNHQAYIACIADSPDWIGCYDHVYIKDLSSLKLYELILDSHLQSRPIFNLLWIGNNVLSVIENSSPQVNTIYGIDIEKKEYVYYSLYYGQCK